MDAAPVRSLPAESERDRLLSDTREAEDSAYDCAACGEAPPKKRCIFLSGAESAEKKKGDNCW
jgi:hypothetical protein